MSFDLATDLLQQKMAATIAGQMVSDVPLGAFLSGGIDSSLIVAIMQEQSQNPVSTFTIGFSEKHYNEAHEAALVAEHLGTYHTEMYVSAQDALNLIPKLSSIYCEPFSDCSQIPTYLISKLASKHVTVSLSGDGGDEVFGGYNRYTLGTKIWKKISKYPLPVRNFLASQLLKIHPCHWDWIFKRISILLPKISTIRTPGYKIHKFSNVMRCSDKERFFLALTSHWNNTAEIMVNTTSPHTLLTQREAWPETDCFEHQMMALDSLTYLPDDILVKVDRAAMACSLETRSPFLDHRIIEFAWNLPLSYKISGGEGKKILRNLLNKYVPKDLIDRPKAGFGVPLDSWLKGPLRDWAESLLDEDRLKTDGFFNPLPIRSHWDDFINGKNNLQYHLWTILIFQSWYEAQRD